jgi:putative N6-adenine-specific DNA methylase
MYAWDMAPGLGRSFAIENFLIADKKIEDAVRENFREKIDLTRTVRIAGSDEEPRSVSIAASNAERLRDIAEGKPAQRGIRSAGKTAAMELKTLPMKEAFCFFDNTGFIVTNPPYGKRLGEQSAAERIYKDMSGLGQRFPGWKLAVITDNSGFESFYGKKADSCREISNGAIPSYFYQYELI